MKRQINFLEDLIKIKSFNADYMIMQLELNSKRIEPK